MTQKEIIDRMLKSALIDFVNIFETKSLFKLCRYNGVRYESALNHLREYSYDYSALFFKNMYDNYKSKEILEKFLSEVYQRPVRVGIFEVIGGKKEINYEVSQVLRDVCEITHITPEKMIGRSRVKEVVEARQLYYYIVKKVLRIGISLQHLANTLNQNHATVLHGINNINNMIETKDQRILTLLNKYYDYRNNYEMHQIDAQLEGFDVQNNVERELHESKEL